MQGHDRWKGEGNYDGSYVRNPALRFEEPFGEDNLVNNLASVQVSFQTPSTGDTKAAPVLWGIHRIAWCGQRS
jgi:hypothetical protein